MVDWLGSGLRGSSEGSKPGATEFPGSRSRPGEYYHGAGPGVDFPDQFAQVWFIEGDAGFFRRPQGSRQPSLFESCRPLDFNAWPLFQEGGLAMVAALARVYPRSSGTQFQRATGATRGREGGSAHHGLPAFGGGFTRKVRGYVVAVSHLGGGGRMNEYSTFGFGGDS